MYELNPLIYKFSPIKCILIFSILFFENRLLSESCHRGVIATGNLYNPTLKELLLSGTNLKFMRKKSKVYWD